MTAEPRRIAVTIAGDWQPVAYVGRALWEGTATANEPITALALGRDGQFTYWSRAGRGDSNILGLKLAVFPDERSESRYDVRMHLGISPPGRTDSTGLASLDINLRLSSTAPFMFSLAHHYSNEPAWFARPWVADDKYDLGALFVPVAETRSARNHLWHLRDGVVAPDGFAEALAYGRSGKIERQGNI
jgi:hypothetical protein